MCGMVGTAGVSAVGNVLVLVREEAESRPGRRTLRCSVKPSVPPMATSLSPSSSRPRFLEGLPSTHC